MFFFGVIGCYEKSEVGVDELLAAETQIVLDNKTLYLETSLYIDGQPSVNGISNELLIAIVRLLSVEGSNPPTDLTASRLWLVKNKKILWESGVDSDAWIKAGNNGAEKTFRSSPSIAIGEKVDVVLSFKYQDVAYYVCVKSQSISITQ